MATFRQNVEADREAALVEVIERVTAVRSIFAENLAFQLEAYKRKKEEAESYLLTHPLETREYPLLTEISQVRGVTKKRLADIWVHKAAFFENLLDLTEIARERAKTSILAATRRAEIRTAIDVLKADLGELAAIEYVEPE